MPAVAADKAAAATLPALRRWQAQRLARTYADLQADERYAQAAAFFLTDLYGDADFAARDQQVRRAYPLIAKALPKAALAPISDALELHALSAELDGKLCEVLAAEFGAKARITDALYAESYRLCRNRAQRLRQIRLIVSVGKDLDRVVARPLLYRMLLLARRPAHSAGFGELQDFLERGFVAFRRMGGAEAFLQTIEKRETLILERLFAGKPHPFDVTTAAK